MSKIRFSKELENIWRAGKKSRNFPEKVKLFQEWLRRFPKVFRLEDWEHMREQPQYHFHECIVAKYYGEKGYAVLIEKYFNLTPHPEKNTLFKVNVPFKVYKLCCESKGTQPPDLFVFKPSECFFVEVKGPGDKIRPPQKNLFMEIRNKSIAVKEVKTFPV